MSSSDAGDFEEIYRQIPTGLTIVVAKSDGFETLQSFCFSLKGIAIRLGGNAKHFNWQYSKKNWLGRGIQHFRSFVEKHTKSGVRLFLINQPTGYADAEVAGLIRETSESSEVRVLLTTIASPTGAGNEGRLAVLQGRSVVINSPSAVLLRGCPFDGYYSATTVFEGIQKHYGPLYFLYECPHTPDELEPADSAAD